MYIALFAMILFTPQNQNFYSVHTDAAQILVVEAMTLNLGRGAPV